MIDEQYPVDNEPDDELFEYYLFRKSEFMFLGGEPLAHEWATEAEISAANDCVMPKGFIWVKARSLH